MAVKKKAVGYAKPRFDILKSITADAKKIREKDLQISWQDAIKKASAAYNKKPVIKTETKKTAPKKIAPKKAAPKKTAKKKAVRGVGAKDATVKKIHDFAKINFVEDMKDIKHFYDNPQKDKELQIGIYAGLCKREELYKNQLAIHRLQYRRNKQPLDKAQIVYYERMLAAIRQQKAIQKKLI